MKSLLIAAVVVAGLAATTRAGEPADITVFAAASLREAFEDLAKTFESRSPGVKVRVNLAGSQELRTQIENGARADVFASADQKHMAALVKARLVTAPRVFARNTFVVIVPRDNPARVGSFEDLPRARKLVIGGPEVPIGAYTPPRNGGSRTCRRTTPCSPTSPPSGTSLSDCAGVAPSASRRRARCSTASASARSQTSIPATLALARALAASPRGLLLDEPLAALDVESRESVRAFLVTELRAQRRPFIVIAHDREDVRAFAAPVAVVERGRIVQRGELASIEASPATTFTARLLGARSAER